MSTLGRKFVGITPKSQLPTQWKASKDVSGKKRKTVKNINSTAHVKSENLWPEFPHRGEKIQDGSHSPPILFLLQVLTRYSLCDFLSFSRPLILILIQENWMPNIGNSQAYYFTITSSSWQEGKDQQADVMTRGDSSHKIELYKFSASNEQARIPEAYRRLHYKSKVSNTLPTKMKATLYKGLRYISKNIRKASLLNFTSENNTKHTHKNSQIFTLWYSENDRKFY